MSRLQMMPHSYSGHVFLEKEVMLDKLPPLQRQRYSYSSPPCLNIAEDKERQRAARNDCQQVFPLKKRSNPILRKYSADTARRKMYSEEHDHEVVIGKSEIDSILPLKPVYHKRAFNMGNCQADSFVQNDRKRLDFHFPSSSQDKQTSKRREEKEEPRKLKLLDTEQYQLSQESNGESLSGYQTLQQDQRRLLENQMKLAKEIHKKKVELQEKLLKAEEKLRKVQLRTESEEKMKREDRNKNMNMEKAKNMLDYTEKGIWDWERIRQRAIAGRREEVQRERNRHWPRDDKDDMEGWTKKPREMNAGQRERGREEMEWENRRRNTQRTINYKSQEKEWSKYDEIMRRKWEMERRDKTKREMEMERARNEMKEQARKDWQKARVYEGEMMRGERIKPKRDIETDEEEQWNIMDRRKSNSNVKEKASSKPAQINGLTTDQWPTLERRNQYSTWPIEKTTKTELHPEAAPHSPPLNQKGKQLQQVELTSDSDADVPLISCNICHRNFAQDRLERHSKICEKMQLSKRKVFDSSGYRAKGTDLEAFIRMRGHSKTPEPKRNNWRQKHEALIRNVRQARVPLPGGFQPQPSADLNPDYITCPHCGRRFAPGPAERHIPKCQNIRSRPPPPRHR